MPLRYKDCDIEIKIIYCLDEKSTVHYFIVSMVENGNQTFFMFEFVYFFSWKVRVSKIWSDLQNCTFRYSSPTIYISFCILYSVFQEVTHEHSTESREKGPSS